MNIDALFDAIAHDYARWISKSGYAAAHDGYASDQDFEEFRAKLSIEEGRKYLKVVKTDTQTMVWGFIVKKDDKQFRAGDILKAATWAAPARNKARGNVVKEDFSWVRWTGPEYL